MNGPAHYAEAERLLDLVTDPGPDGKVDSRDVMILYVAQIHATLAQAAAAVLGPMSQVTGRTAVEWRKATVVPQPECEYPGCTQRAYSIDRFCLTHEDADLEEGPE